MPGKKDEYVQMGYLSVTESGAGTLTFAGLTVYSNVMGQKGLLIHRVDYNIAEGTLDDFAAAGDSLTFGLVGDNSLSGISLDNPAVYDYNYMVREDFGTAGNAKVYKNPVIKNYTELPGGGLLVPADRLYAYAQGGSLTDAATITARFYFTIMDLNAQDYLELAQALRVLK